MPQRSLLSATLETSSPHMHVDASEAEGLCYRLRPYVFFALVEYSKAFMKLDSSQNSRYHGKYLGNGDARRLRFKQKVSVWIQKKLHLNAVASRAEMTVSSIFQQEVILLTCTEASWMYQFGRFI